MQQTTIALVDRMEKAYPALAGLRAGMLRALEILIGCYRGGGKLLTCGNGGSAADAQHVVGELMKSFVLPRCISAETEAKLRAVSADADLLCQNLQGALPAISLVGEHALQTAYANDMAPELCFAQMVYGLGKPGDVLLAISTSGNSRNIVYATDVARAGGMRVIALTGITGGTLREHCDVLLNVPRTQTYQVQELHLPVYHTLCLALENEFFGCSE